MKILARSFAGIALFALFTACRRPLGRRTERAIVSLGIFQVVPEDRCPSREDRDRNQPKLDADRFDDMKLHITETEEASPSQGEAEDYGYRFTCPRPLRHTSLNLPRVGLSHSQLNPAHYVQALAPQSAGFGARASLKN